MPDANGPFKYIQPSFASGEISPFLEARVDLTKYRIGAAELTNFFVDYRGGATSRPGTEFVGRCIYSDTAVRLIKFQFGVEQTYVLEFGHEYMRVITGGGYVLEPRKDVTNITNATHGLVTSEDHGFANGDWVFFDSVNGMLDVNLRTFIVASATTDNFRLNDLNGNPLNTTGYGAYTDDGHVSRIFTMEMPYLSQSLPTLKFAQSADVMTLVHPSYRPRDLTRTDHHVWTLTLVDFEASIEPPENLVGTPETSGATGYLYAVTAVSDDFGDESLQSEVVLINGDDFADPGSKWNKITWDAVDGAGYYNVYRAPAVASEPVPDGALLGLVGATEGLEFVDNNITPDFSSTPPKHKNPFELPNYPGVVTYFQQRKFFAATRERPASIWATQVGAFHNMNKSLPVRPSDAIEQTLAALEVNSIEAMVPMPGGLVVLTAGGAWQVSGDGQGGPITPMDFNAQPQAYNGTSHLPPITVGHEILYVQARGSTVRDLSYNFFANIYTGADMSILSSHMFTGFQMREWAYAEEPFRMVHVVRDPDGNLLNFTFLKEQELYAWTRYETDGSFRSICSVPEEDEDAIYVVVNRTVGGQTVKYVERFFSRLFETVADARCLDCATAYPAGTRVTCPRLEYLEGRTDVYALADGVVRGPFTVVNGRVTLPVVASNVVVGLPYEARLKTLRLELGEPTVQGKKKRIANLTIRMHNTRGLKYGADFDTMFDVKGIQTGPLFSGDREVHMQSTWNMEGQICLKVTSPLPATILGVIPEIAMGDMDK